jgi:hypothetical protein
VATFGETPASPLPSKSKKRREIEDAIRLDMQAALMAGMARHEPPTLLLIRALMAAGLPIGDTAAMFGISENGLAHITETMNEEVAVPTADESE